MIKHVNDISLLSGGKYTGDFDTDNNVPHGKGIYETKNIKYEGKFKQGNFYGVGVLIDKVRNYKYIGDFKDNSKCGFGAIIRENGDYFEGIFENDSINGIGYQVFKDGEKYIGEFKNNIANGKGTVYYSNGNIYTGYFVNDKEDGIGIVMEKGNSEYAIKVQYEMGKGKILNPVKLTSELNTHLVYRIIIKEETFLGIIDKYGKYIDGIYHYPSNHQFKVFIGEINEEFKKGILYLNNGDKYEGYFENDEITGEGIYETFDGEIFIGEFDSGLKQGAFIYYNFDGIKEKRVYNNNVLIKQERLVQ